MVSKAKRIINLNATAWVENDDVGGYIALPMLQEILPWGNQIDDDGDERMSLFREALLIPPPSVD